MARGRPPKTTAQHKADGTFNVTRHGRRLEIQTVDTIPPPPDHFDDAHRKAWFDICGILHRTGLLADADLDAIETYVEAKILRRTTYALLLAEGLVIDGRKNPLHMIYDAAVKTMQGLYDRFGITPLARTRLKAEKPIEEEKDPLDFLN